MTTPLSLNTAFIGSFDSPPKPHKIFYFSSKLSPSSSSYCRWVGAKRTQQNPTTLSSTHMWLCGCMRGDHDMGNWRNEAEDNMCRFGSDEEIATKVPTQLQSVVEGSGTLTVSEFKPAPDMDYLQELLAIQQQGPRSIGFFGTRNMGFMHQQLIEILSYAMVITV